MEQQDVIRVIDLKKQYENEGVISPVLHGLHFGVHKGEFIAIMGPSGSGKSTMLHLIGLLDDITKGSLKVKEQDAKKM